MRGLVVLWVLMLACFVAPPLTAEDPPRPAAEGFITDMAGVMTDAGRRSLESWLDQVYASTKQQGFPVKLVVVTVRDTGGETVEAMAPRLGQQWGVGETRNDGGGLLLVAVDERKFFMATGYGLEPHLTDLMSARLGKEYLTPHFRRGDYDTGLKEYLKACVAEICDSKGLTIDESLIRRRPKSRGRDASAIAYFVIFFILIVISIIRRGGGGGGWGGGIYIGGGGFGGSSFGGGGFSGGSFGGGFGGGGFGGGGGGGSW